MVGMACFAAVVLAQGESSSAWRPALAQAKTRAGVMPPQLQLRVIRYDIPRGNEEKLREQFGDRLDLQRRPDPRTGATLWPCDEDTITFAGQLFRLENIVPAASIGPREMLTRVTVSGDGWFVREAPLRSTQIRIQRRPADFKPPDVATLTPLGYRNLHVPALALAQAEERFAAFDDTTFTVEPDGRTRTATARGGLTVWLDPDGRLSQVERRLTPEVSDRYEYSRETITGPGLPVVPARILGASKFGTNDWLVGGFYETVDARAGAVEPRLFQWNTLAPTAVDTATGEVLRADGSVDQPATEAEKETIDVPYTGPQPRDAGRARWWLGLGGAALIAGAVAFRVLRGKAG